METYIALLRGVNVAGTNKLPMKIFGAMCEEHGCKAVKTYIQSGNVVFRASAKLAANFAAAIEKRIQTDLGFTTTVILRTVAEWRAAIANNPYVTPTVDIKSLYVIFLAAAPNVAAAIKLNPACVNDEAFTLRGREIFLYLPHGAGRSKMGSYRFDKVLGTIGSARNWQTVQKLLASAEEITGSPIARRTS